MKISIDGGALCTDPDKRFGNYIFSLNLLQALSLYDKGNNYLTYSFCPQPQNLKLNSNFKFKSIFPRQLWMSLSVSLQERMNKRDIFLALNQAIPRTNSKIIGFSHGLSFYFYRQLYPDSSSSLLRQVKTMIDRSDVIVVSSSKVKKEIVDFASREVKIIVLPFGVPFDFLSYRYSQRKKYWLYVGMDHQIKNLSWLRQAFNEFKRDIKFRNFELLLVNKSLIGRQELKQLYQEASGYLTTSLYESFNLPILEALSQNCPVIGLKSAIIPEFVNYVNIATDKVDFVRLMKEISSGDYQPVKRKQLLREFSWKNYVKHLIDFY